MSSIEDQFQTLAVAFVQDHGPFHHRTTGTYQLIKKLTRELADKIRLYERKIVVLQILLAQLEKSACTEFCIAIQQIRQSAPRQ